MQNLILYDWAEIFALVISVVMGTGTYLGFMKLNRGQKVKLSSVGLVLIMNLTVTYVASEILKKTSLGEYRTISLPIIAYLGQYFLEWLDKTYPKIFNAGAKKLGIDIESTDTDIEQENNNLDEKEN